MGDSASVQGFFKLKSVPVEGRTGTGADQVSPTECKRNRGDRTHATLKQACMKRNYRMLPKGSVGAKCTAQIRIGDVQTSCLLDTGSQVTTVSHSFFQKHLPDHQISSLSDLLEVEGANGQSVPHLGYVELCVAFPKEFVGVGVQVPTLALVVPDTRTGPQPHVLIGTNALDVLYETASEDAAESPESASYGYRAVPKVLELRQQQHQGSAFRLVELHDRSPQLIPAGQTVVLNGCAVVNEHTNETSALLEHPTWGSFLGVSGYYRRFIKDYSCIVKPLTDLTSGYPPQRKSAKLNPKA